MSLEPLPPLVHDIIQDREGVKERYPLYEPYRTSRQRPPRSSWRRLLPVKSTPQPDTPSAAFYRIYEFLVADWNVQLRNELEYFCRDHPEWAIVDIPDPADPDPLRYAVLATTAKLMCMAFNRRVGLGLPRDAPAIIEDFEELARRPRLFEQPPAWANEVPPVKEMVSIPNEEGALVLEDDEAASQEFKKMNILMAHPHIHFV